MVGDALDVNERLRPEVVVLDEAQRIKNWNTKTAQAIKRLRSRYAFVLTGTPIENRIDELHSLMDFLNPSVLGPLFRFNRDFYELDDRGRPVGYRQLDRLHARIKPCLLRRRKAEVETELPPRSDRNHFVPLSDSQREKIDGNLVRCEERYPLEGAHSMVLVVVDQGAHAWRERLLALHDEFFNRETTDPLAPTRVEVIDRATDEAVQRLIAAGVLAKTDRAVRPLPPSDAVPIPPTLSPEEQARVAACQQQAERKLKVARLLADGDLAEEARAALLEGTLCLARALAVGYHLPEPPTLEEALRPPLALHWKEGARPIREFLESDAKPAAGLVEFLLSHRCP